MLIACSIGQILVIVLLLLEWSPDFDFCLKRYDSAKAAT